jgi:hypothetical protein
MITALHSDDELHGGDSKKRARTSFPDRREVRSPVVKLGKGGD